MITKEDALSHSMFYHTTLRNSDGTAVRCRANGKCKIWKRDPKGFRLPVKYGLKECFYLTPANANQWCVFDPTEDHMKKQEDEILAGLAKTLSEEPWITLKALSDRLEELGDTTRVKGLQWLILKRRQPSPRLEGRVGWSWNDQSPNIYGTPITLPMIPLWDIGHKLPFIAPLTPDKKRTKFFPNTYEAYMYASLVIGEMIEALEKK